MRLIYINYLSFCMQYLVQECDGGICSAEDDVDSAEVVVND